MLPLGDNLLPIFPLFSLLFSPCKPLFCLQPRLGSIHCFIDLLCVVHLTKSSIKLDRLTVTSVSELETDWRLILCCLFWLCFVALTSSNQQPLQTSNSNPPYQHKPKRKHPHHLSNQTAVLSFPCMQKQKQDPTQCTETSDSATLHNWTFYPHIASRAYN